MDTPAPRNISVHFPLTLVALSLAIFFWSQIGAASRTSDTIQWQLGNLDKGLAEVKDAQKQLGDLIARQGPVLEQAKAVQEQYTKLLNDVLDLAKNDADTQAVVEKWKIQRTEAPAGAAGGEAGAAPAPAGGAAPAQPAK